VEQVIHRALGFYTLTVKAVTLAGDGIPANADTTDQDSPWSSQRDPYRDDSFGRRDHARRACSGTGGREQTR